MGIAAGIIPCPEALSVLLLAIGLNRTAVHGSSSRRLGPSPVCRTVCSRYGSTGRPATAHW
jgi:hypothetical protein